jgi:hypothetical protein
MHLYCIMLAIRTQSIGKSESMLEQGVPSIALKPTPLPLLGKGKGERIREDSQRRC